MSNQDYDLTLLYCRLSREDALEGDSNSIENQKKIILKAAQDYNFDNLVWLIDDGFTGTNFDRPDFQKGMKLIEEGRVKNFITKDLSRLGRNYLQVGMYTDVIFICAYECCAVRIRTKYIFGPGLFDSVDDMSVALTQFVGSLTYFAKRIESGDLINKHSDVKPSRAPGERSGNGVYLSEDGSIPLGLSIGTLIVGDDGTWAITGVRPDGGYKTVLVDEKQTIDEYKKLSVPAYANGTSSAKGRSRLIIASHLIPNVLSATE